MTFRAFVTDAFTDNGQLTTDGQMQAEREWPSVNAAIAELRDYLTDPRDPDGQAASAVHVAPITVDEDGDDDVDEHGFFVDRDGDTVDRNGMLVTVPGVIGDDEIRDLLIEAAAAGDGAQVNLCNDALAGDADARAECVRVIEAARAMDDSSGDEG